MVGNPIDDYAQAELVSLCYEIVEILEGSEFRVDLAVVPDCIV